MIRKFTKTYKGLKIYYVLSFYKYEGETRMEIEGSTAPNFIYQNEKNTLPNNLFKKIQAGLVKGCDEFVKENYNHMANSKEPVMFGLATRPQK